MPILSWNLHMYFILNTGTEVKIKFMFKGYSSLSDSDWESGILTLNLPNLSSWGEFIPTVIVTNLLQMEWWKIKLCYNTALPGEHLKPTACTNILGVVEMLAHMNLHEPR